MNREESDLRHLRRAYMQDYLDKTEVESNPFKQFEQWFQEAVDAEDVIEPNAMILATSTPAGKPAARTLLLKGVKNDGFVFYTNYNSRKGKEIASNPQAAILFFWDRLERQIRIEGRVKKIAPEESDTYFATRPKGSRLGALASPQSQVIEGREVLENKLAQLTLQYENTNDVPRPPHWGGYLLEPDYFEFWQGRLNRLHDRIAYQLSPKNEWVISRLAP